MAALALMQACLGVGARPHESPDLWLMSRGIMCFDMA